MKSIGGVDAIMITHGHCDKLRGLAAAMKTNAKAVAWIHELDQPYLHDPKRNCSVEEGTARDRREDLHLRGVHDDDRRPPRPAHPPAGHTEGSTIFWFPDDNTMIGGDTVMSTQIGSASLPGGIEASRTAPIAKFKKLTFPSDTRRYNGHDASTTHAELMKSHSDLA